VISHLRNEIVRIYGSQIASDVLSRAPHRSLVEVLDRLSPVNVPLYFFTTNYDAIIEQILQDEQGISLAGGRKLRVCTGFTADRPGRWRPELLCAHPARSERLIHIVKLHGSATWKKDGSGPIETGWGMPTPHDCLLYFGYKGIPEQEPFITLHELLKTALLECAAVIVIGFRFGDPYIRELFDFALRANPTLRVICCLTRAPEAKSPLSAMMDRFSGRVLLLVDAEGKAIPFGDVRFGEILEDTLRSSRQSSRASI
jgi:SIR2-like domain